MMRRPVVLAVVAALALGAGCGGGDDPGPDAAVRDYYRALLQGDGTRACALLTDDLSRDIAASRGARTAGGTCRDVLTLAAGLNPDRAGDDLHELRVQTSVDGDSGSVRLANPLTGKPETLRVQREGGKWHIASLVLRPQR